ncbi:MAG: hypothetical protein IT259_18470 [Saprospiraceae bacterium]|nr:hypothetical protein [Saprospiraceae bacterium]
MSDLVRQIESLLQKKLHPVEARGGDLLDPLMRVKDNTPKVALEGGHLIGLNLARTGLDDQKWQQILALPGLADHLRALNLCENKLTRFPFPEGKGLRRLEKLHLGDNALKEFALPADAGGVAELDLEGNPLQSPPPDVMALGKKEVLKWLKDTGKRPVLEAKIMFIGDSNFGKTHLIEMLQHSKIKREINTTHGIERCRMKSAPSKDGSVRLNVWDLGGQQFMRSTHQFFFTERTLYVLVTVARRERKDLNHWLQLVREIGGNAPVLVVINKTDVDDHDIDREPLRREYPNIVGFVRTAVYDNPDRGVVALDTIRELETTIHTIVSNRELMPSVFVEQRPEWFVVKDELEDMKEEFISLEQYRRMEHIKTLPDDEQLLYLKQLSSLGTVVSFVDDPRLKDTHVINPEWIMDGVYTIINDLVIKEKRRGEFSFAHLKGILPGKRYPSEKYPFLVDLMGKFKLCYPVRNRENTFLLPDLFADIEPAEVWPDEKAGLRFRFNYGSFPCDLFMTQFIVERYADIVGEKRWRSGVVVGDGRNCEAIVRRSFANELIEIEVSGPEKQRRGYLQELLGTFRDLHRPFDNLEVVREVPYENIWLNYDHLLIFEEQKQPYFHPVLMKNIPVSEILDGYASDERDPVSRQLDRMEAKMDAIADDTSFLRQLGIDQMDLLEKLHRDKQAAQALLMQIQQGIDKLLPQLPPNDPIAAKAQTFKTEPDIKTKLKIGLNLLFMTLETEVNWDIKNLFRQIVQDMKDGHIFTKP